MEGIQIIDTSVLQNYSRAASGSQPEQFPVGRRKRLPHNFHPRVLVTSLTPADVRGPAHSTGAGGHGRGFRFSIGMGRESGKRGGEIRLPATWTGNRIAIMA